jgi:hypothetical protein
MSPHTHQRHHDPRQVLRALRSSRCGAGDGLHAEELVLAVSALGISKVPDAEWSWPGRCVGECEFAVEARASWSWARSRIVGFGWSIPIYSDTITGDPARTLSTTTTTVNLSVPFSNHHGLGRKRRLEP